MKFSVSPWLFLAVAAAGIFLSGLHLFRSRGAVSRLHLALFALSAAAWLGLAALVARPLRISGDAVYHPPSVALAVDISRSHAGGETLRMGAAVRRGMKTVREHYRSLGFRVWDFEFGEVVLLRRLLDSIELPNLQAVFLWTDGRFQAEPVGAAAGLWPAPVYPVIPEAGEFPAHGGAQNHFPEVQGERVVLESGDADSGAEIAVEWRPLGPQARDARLDLLAGGKGLWSGRLPNPGAPSGTLLRRVFRLPRRIYENISESESPLALIRPGTDSANISRANDTVEIRVAGRIRARHFFARPRSLEERGLMDALRAAESLAVSAGSPSAGGFQPGDVSWARVPPELRAPALVLYSFPAEGASDPRAFTAEARVAWSETAAPFLPAGVLRLGDLGEGAWRLAKPDSTAESLAWAEEDGRKGLLLSREVSGGVSVFRFAVPPLWASAFRSSVDDRIGSLQRGWVQGAGNLAHQQSLSSGKSDGIGKKPIRDPGFPELSRLGFDAEALAALAASTRGAVLRDAPSGDGKGFSALLPELPRGQLREENRNARPLFPFYGMTLAVVACLCTAWALRKKYQLD